MQENPLPTTLLKMGVSWARKGELLMETHGGNP